MTHLIRSLLATLLFVALPAEAGLQPTDDPQASAIWQKVRASLFDNRPIAAAREEELGRSGCERNWSECRRRNARSVSRVAIPW